MQLPALLTYALTLASQFKYPLVFLITIVEGPILMVVAGFLYHQGFFSLAPLFITIAVGDLAGDVIWYGIGKFFAEPLLRKHGRFLSVTPELFEKGKGLFRKYETKILLISKMTLGFGMALVTLMVAGATHVRFRTYMFLNIIGEFVLVTMLLLAGYFFGQLYNYIADGFKTVFFIGAIAMAVVALYGFSRYMKKKIASL